MQSWRIYILLYYIYSITVLHIYIYVIQYVMHVSLLLSINHEKLFVFLTGNKHLQISGYCTSKASNKNPGKTAEN